MQGVGSTASPVGRAPRPAGRQAPAARWRRDLPTAVELLLLAEEVCLALGLGFGEPAADTRASERR
jgi:hypothetical protein